MLKRYTKPPFDKLWTPQSEWDHVLQVELAALEARCQVGDVSREAVEAIRQHARVNPERIGAFEKETGHDVVAFVMDVQQSLREAGVGQFATEFHKRLTSFDGRDPALMLQLRTANDAIITELMNLAGAIRLRALEHRKTIMIARTHAQFAEPDSFGRLLLGFAQDVGRSVARLKLCQETELSEAKMSGAVGNYAGMDPRIEAIALKLLGLRPATVETQILQRDRHAAFIASLAIAMGSVARLARTLHTMSHSLIAEIQEPRSAKQKGSSIMPGKKNPITLEQLFGLPRLLRGFSSAAIEDIDTLECRDISQSIVERHIFPDATSLAYYGSIRATDVMGGLVVFPERMRENLQRSYGVWAGAPLREALMEAGVDYEAAYTFVQQACFSAIEHRRQMVIEVIHGEDRRLSTPHDDRPIREIVGEKKWNLLLNPWEYIEAGVEQAYSQAS